MSAIWPSNMPLTKLLMGGQLRTSTDLPSSALRWPMFALLFGGDADMFEGYWLEVNRTLLISESVSFILCLDFLLKEIGFFHLLQLISCHGEQQGHGTKKYPLFLCQRERRNLSAARKGKNSEGIQFRADRRRIFKADR